MRILRRKRSRLGCYNQPADMMNLLQANLLPNGGNLPALLRDWREDSMNFLRHDAPKIVLVVLAASKTVRMSWAGAA